MNNELKLIVAFDKDKTRKALTLIPFMILITIIGYLSINHWLIKIIFILLGLFFLTGLLYGFFLIKSTQPAAILDQKGITIKRFGFIAWQEIDEFAPYYAPGTPLETIGIRVKNNAMLSRQSSLAGKCAIFWSKLFGYPPIILANIALENHQVLFFAAHFLKSYKKNSYLNKQ